MRGSAATHILRGMPAPPMTSRRVNTATRSVQFNNSLFDAKTLAQGAETEDEKARLCNVDRSTLWRYRTGSTVQLLDLAMRCGAGFDRTVAERWSAAPLELDGAGVIPVGRRRSAV